MRGKLLGLVMAGMSACAVPAVTSRPAIAAELPAQAKQGPGGQDYPVSRIAMRAYGFGSGQGIVFRPADAPSADAFTKGRPVVVFLHGWGAISPKWYGGWIEHLVRKGNIVIFPRYQEAGGGTPYAEVNGEAVKGIRAALEGLAALPEARADLGRVAFVGHQAGAVIAANLAARAEADGLPVPKLVFAVTPTRIPTDAKTRAVPLSDLASVNAATNVVVVTGDRDTVAGEAGARAILRAVAPVLKAEHRLLIRVNSDNHGQPPLVAGHYSAASPNEAYDLAKIEDAMKAPPAPAAGAGTTKDKAAERAAREAARKDQTERWFRARQEQTDLQMMEMQKTDAFDFYGLWRTLDIALERTFSGGDAASIRRDNRIYDMGLWNDGWPMRRLTIESPRDQTPPATGGIASPKN